MTVDSMADFKPVISAIIGLGGYGETHLDLFNRDVEKGTHAAKLAYAMDVDLSLRQKVCDQLRGQGVGLFESYDELLAQKDLEAVWLPVPIDLHRVYTEKALAAGKAVMCEKPVAGCIDDIDAMIAARDKYNLPVAIGYQDVYDMHTLPLKRRILEGEFGKIESVSLHACWPRNSQYYGRASWAGAYQRNGIWVMDSPANNALSHYINIMMYMLGPDIKTSAKPVKVEAELYRANAIENFDTISCRVTLDSGTICLINMTHASEETVSPYTLFKGSKGNLVRTTDYLQAETDQGIIRTERNTVEHSVWEHMVERFGKLVRGIDDDQIGLATLETARVPVAIVNAASQASQVANVPKKIIRTVNLPSGHTLKCIPGIEDAFRECARTGKMLHELGRFDWTQKAGVFNMTNYYHFAGPKGATVIS
ncbi:MAG: Gfo/Idh/MocA family oxidoreductase [Phycisphaeraceae bacterium]|nr:Gfo/Idh/MocA family oxidoreductase [Phycisphaeraceae bacterium]